MKAVARSRKVAGLLSAAIVTAGAVFSAGALAAGTVSLTVNATVSGVCKVTAGTTAGATTINIGTIDPSGTANASASAAPITLKCTNGTTSLAWDVGGTPIGAAMARTMTGTAPANTLGYTLSVTGDAGFAGTGFGAGSTGSTVSLTATVTPAQFGNAVADAYTEVVAINVNP